MEIFKKHGTKEKLFEMMERVNKIKLNETVDNPVDDDEIYLNQGGDDKALAMQPNKYDDGTRAPRNRDVQVKNEPSIEKMRGDDEPIVEAGLGGYDPYQSPEWMQAKKEAFPRPEEIQQIWRISLSPILPVWTSSQGLLRSPWICWRTQTLKR